MCVGSEDLRYELAVGENLISPDESDDEIDDGACIPIKFILALKTSN